jgi:hypothetical protein
MLAVFIVYPCEWFAVFSHPDFKMLTKSLETVSNVAMHINEMVRAAENSTVMFDIQDAVGSFCGQICIAGFSYSRWLFSSLETTICWLLAAPSFAKAPW